MFKYGQPWETQEKGAVWPESVPAGVARLYPIYFKQSPSWVEKVRKWNVEQKKWEWEYSPS